MYSISILKASNLQVNHNPEVIELNESHATTASPHSSFLSELVVYFRMYFARNFFWGAGRNTRTTVCLQCQNIYISDLKVV